MRNLGPMNINNDRTVSEVYNECNLNPDEYGIVMACDHVGYIPIPPRYNDTPFQEALEDMARKLEPKGIRIGNLLVPREMGGDALHHFMAFSLETVLKMSLKYDFNDDILTPKM